MRQIKTLLRLLALLIAATECLAQPGLSSTDTRSTNGLSIKVDHGRLVFNTPAGTVLSNLRLRFNFALESSVLGDLELTQRSNEQDKSGSYERLSYSFIPAASPHADNKTPVKATLEIRQYSKPVVIVASLDYDGPALAARDGIQLISAIERFERGMAIRRFKLYWTSPVFVSDYRLLSSANQLVLWRQTNADKYHLLVPLAGDGLVGEVGVSEIDFRPEFRIASSSYDQSFIPRHIPLFAYATSDDPYQLARDTYQVAFAATGQYGKLRWQKAFPEIFSWLGWCSWNAYGHDVTEEKILASMRSVKEKQIPLGFVLVDDGWLTTQDNKLTAFNADSKKFPHDLAGLASSLRQEYQIPHVGVWHTFQGYWSGVENSSDIGRSHTMFRGIDDKYLPDPRNEAGQSFYDEWYQKLRSWGIDFVKVDGQGNNVKFTNGLLPLFVSGGGEHRNFQQAAERRFSDSGNPNPSLSRGLNVINCMEMSLENTYNWNLSNVARNSDDYLPDNPQNAKEHIYQNAYNAYWMSNFAYPDWDMFQSRDPNAEYHAVARAVSGGPIYFTDEAGKERADILKRLATSDGKLLMLDAPGLVTRDLLLTDVALEPVALKVSGTISRPGLTAGVIGTFNTNKSARNVSGTLGRDDIEGLSAARNGPIAVYERSTGRVVVLNTQRTTHNFSLAEYGFDLFTVSPIKDGIAVFGLLDKYLGPAAVVSQRVEKNQVIVKVREAGDFGAWLERRPVVIKVDARTLPASSYSYVRGLLTIPKSSFANASGEREVILGL